MNAWPHWIVVPVVLPLLAGAVLVVIERTAERAVRPVSVAATLAGFGVALLLLSQADAGIVQTYLLGNWPAPFGIVFVLDRLSALMLVLTAILALAALLWALAGEDRRGAHFHALFQFQLAGLHGAFLTGDLFNLFVFFEVLLISSYGLLLHGGGRARLRAAVHYVALNLAGSALFLVAVSLLYAVTGTLNMADLASKVAALTGTAAWLAQTAGALLFVVFTLKAALLPLSFWLPQTYGSAPAPVAALFAVMTKVGIYASLRVSTLLFGPGAGEAAQLADPILPMAAMATLAFAALAALGVKRLRLLASYAIIASAGTLLIAFGLGSQATIAGGAFYLVNTTLVTAALFMLADWVQRARAEAGDRVTAQRDYPGRLGLGALFFGVAIGAAGLPPLAGFLGKVLVLQGAWPLPLGAWVFAVVLTASLLLVVAFARVGITLFWEYHAPQVAESAAAARAVRFNVPSLERAGFAVLVVSALAAALFAGRLAEYTQALAEQLTTRTAYLESVRQQTPAPPAFDVRREMRERGGK
ncbi:MAG: monovalent cation/H+ antiporter subunit D [Casimicrobiaceae bacterium]|nr:monovalent cation/H+ antiporter subunit D [Casimicrobiaceae bacterium]MDW8311831.1 monovalent cation/H+ antiporter subunit D [Burkholderiales bacterium]